MITTEIGPRQVNAVSTTGIYCRAGCAGRPLPQNCSTLPGAVAAEAAGYRACLLCRPDRRPNELLDRQTPSVVRQAIMLIGDGALDRGDEAQLGRRIGISPRQLRRLFEHHVGATPSFLARSRRAHFARRMPDETDLPIGQVAGAAGFRSVRDMNRVMKETFRFTPTELRTRRRVADRLVADGGLRLRIPHADDFDFVGALRYLGARAVPRVEAISDGVYRRVTDTCGHPGALEIGPGDAGGAHIEVTAHLPTFNNLADDVARCRRLLGIDADLREGHELLAGDELLGAIVQAAPGVTIPGAWDRFETSVRIMLGQQVTVRAASTISGRVAQRFGTPVPGLDAFGLGRIFPSADRLATAEMETMGMPSARARGIRAFARAVADGDLDLYDGSDLPDLLARLQSTPGIGPWTANMIAMRAYGHTDAFPAGDLGLRKAAALLLGQDDVSASDLDRLSERWRPWRSLAAMHLWASLA